MKVAIVGAGWAGLSAAVHLHRNGHQAVVFEASQTLGGRARSVQSSRLGITIDNGQHILLGAYSATLTLLEDLGVDVALHLFRQRLSVRAADGSFVLKSPSWPPPLHVLGALLGAHGLSPLEKLRLVIIAQQLRRRKWKLPPGLTVEKWLCRHRQSARVIRHFWAPLCVATLNTPIERACARTFARVLRDSLGGGAGATDTLVPRVDLSHLWPQHIPAAIDIRRGRAVRQVASDEDQVQVDGETFDAVILATNARAAHRLLKAMPESEAGNRYLDKLGAFEYAPIATIALQLEHAWPLPHAMLKLTEHPEKLQYGQWLFNHSVITDDTVAPGRQTLVTVVISDARALADHSHADVVSGVVTQIQEQTRQFPAMPKLVAYELINEKRATFVSVPYLKRPGNQAPWPRIWVAGDWTNTRYPAVLEGAIRSGNRAAAMISACDRHAPVQRGGH